MSYDLSELTENHVIINYKNFAKNVIDKYPNYEVEKPDVFTIVIVEQIPSWIKNNAGWWADGKIDDNEFLTSMHFLIKNGIVVLELPDTIQLTEEEKKIADRNEWQFFRYLDRIEKRVYDEIRDGIDFERPDIMMDYNKAIYKNIILLPLKIIFYFLTKPATFLKKKYIYF